MLTPVEMEQVIEDTGGVPVVIGSVSTWAHFVPAAATQFGAGGGLSGEGGTPPSARVIQMPAGSYPTLAVGAEILVDGVAVLVRASRPSDRRGLVLVLIAERTHTLSVYREAETWDEDPQGRPVLAWEPVALDVAANLEPALGGINASDAGVEVVGEWRGFIPPGHPVRENDGVLVTSGAGPERYRVTFVAEHGPSWDAALTLRRTEEVFPVDACGLAEDGR